MKYESVETTLLTLPGGGGDYYRKDPVTGIVSPRTITELRSDLGATGGTVYQISNGLVQAKTIVDNNSGGRTTTSTTFVSTGISATLTNNLQSTASKVRIRFSAQFCSAPDSSQVDFTVFRDATDLLPANVGSLGGGYVASQFFSNNIDFEIEDTPGTVTPATYTVYWRVNAGATGTLGRRGFDAGLVFPSYLAVEEMVDSIAPIAANLFQLADPDLTAIAGLTSTTARSFIVGSAGGWTSRALQVADLPDLSLDYQPFSSDLNAIDALTGTTGGLYKTGTNTWALSSRLQAIAAAPNPSAIQIPQLATDGTLSLIDSAPLAAINAISTQTGALARSAGTYTISTNLPLSWLVDASAPSLMGRSTAGAGTYEELTPAAAKTLLGLASADNRLEAIASFADPATAKLPQINTDGTVSFIDVPSGGGGGSIAANTISGNNTGAAAAPTGLTPAQTKTLLGLASTDNRLEAIATKPDPSVIEIPQLNTDGTITFINATRLKAFVDRANPSVVEQPRLQTDGTIAFVRAPFSQNFTTVGTTTISIASIQDFTYYEFDLVGGGGGGGSGRLDLPTNVANGGGGGGAGGGRTKTIGNVAELVAIATASSQTNITITVGAAGTGGAAITTTGQGGSPGTAGGNSSVAIGSRTISIAGGGGGGSGGTTSGGAGGNTFGLYTTGGGTGSGSAGTPFNAYAPAAGGGGGNITIANAASGGGRAGSSAHADYSVHTGNASSTAGVAGGTANGTASTVQGGNGTALTIASGVLVLGAAGSGGGAHTTAAAGTGGNGTIYGGGGGGGGAARTVSSGKGGDGAQGYVKVRFW